jgi:hypothetical protein
MGYSVIGEGEQYHVTCCVKLPDIVSRISNISRCRLRMRITMCLSCVVQNAGTDRSRMSEYQCHVLLPKGTFPLAFVL